MRRWNKGQNKKRMRSKLCHSPGGVEENVEGVEWGAWSVVYRRQKMAV